MAVVDSTEPIPSRSGDEPDGREVPAQACSRCDAPLSPGAQVCPSCGRKQFRVCLCGAVGPADLAQCAVCGTDWNDEVRIRRRSRSGRVRPRHLLHSALVGAVITVLGSAALNLTISALARRSAGGVPAHLGERLYHAGVTLGTAFTAVFSRLVGVFGPLILLALIGAGIGTAVYLVRSGCLSPTTFLPREHRDNLRRRRRR